MKTIPIDDKDGLPLQIMACLNLIEQKLPFLHGPRYAMSRRSRTVRRAVHSRYITPYVSCLRHDYRHTAYAYMTKWEVPSCFPNKSREVESWKFASHIYRLYVLIIFVCIVHQSELSGWIFRNPGILEPARSLLQTPCIQKPCNQRVHRQQPQPHVKNEFTTLQRSHRNLDGALMLDQ